MRARRTPVAITLIITPCLATLTNADTLSVPSATYPTIQSAVDAAIDGDVVQIAPGTYAENVIVTAKAITISGDAGKTPTIIDAGANGSGIRATGWAGDLAIENLTLINGAATSGGGIFARPSTSAQAMLTVTNCRFTSNTAAVVGGGLSFSAIPGAGSVRVEDCDFTDNHATLDTGLSGAGGGASIVSNRSVEVVNCNFTGNSARFRSSGAGGMNIQIQSAGTAQVTGCTFTGNQSTAPIGEAESLDHSGGGLYIQGSGDSAVVSDCQFVGNSAMHDPGSELDVGQSYGGGLAISSGIDLTLTDCEFIENRGHFGGGFGRWLTPTDAGTTIESCHFERNHARGGGGATGATSVNDSTFIENTAGGFGALGSAERVTNSAFIRNRVIDLEGVEVSEGGAIGDAKLIYRCEFIENSSFGDGGAISLVGSPQAPFQVVRECRFVNNHADVGGGAIKTRGFRTLTDCDDPSSGDNALIIDTCEFIGNSAGPTQFGIGGGGAIHISNGSDTQIGLWCTNSTFVDNASPDGALLFIRRGGVRFSNCIITGDHQSQNLVEADHGLDNHLIDFRRCIISAGFAGSYILDVDPLFVDPLGPDNLPATGDEDYRLRPGSPAIDAGDNAFVAPDFADIDQNADLCAILDTDLDAAPRFMQDPGKPDIGLGSGPITDLGAFEFQGVSLAGDANGDNAVDINDLNIIFARWGQIDLPGTTGDLNADGFVNIEDLNLILANFGA